MRTGLIWLEAVAISRAGMVGGGVYVMVTSLEGAWMAFWTGEVKIGFAAPQILVVRSIRDITRGHLESRISNLFSLFTSRPPPVPSWCLLTQ